MAPISESVTWSGLLQAGKMLVYYCLAAATLSKRHNVLAHGTQTMQPEDFKNFKLPHTNAEDRENARVLKALGGDPKEGANWPWYYFALMGLAMAAIAVFCYYDLSTAEQTGRAIRLPRFVGIFYDLFGKWGVVGFFAAVSLLSTGVGIWSLVAPAEKPILER